MSISADFNSRLVSAVEWLRGRYAPKAIVLYGSRAVDDHARRDSDADLGLLLGQSRPGAFELAAAKVEMEHLLGCDVDLVILDEASPVLAMEVLRGHRVLDESDPDAWTEFFVRTLTDYADLKIVRRDIEQDLLRRSVP